MGRSPCVRVHSGAAVGTVVFAEEERAPFSSPLPFHSGKRHYRLLGKEAVHLHDYKLGGLKPILNPLKTRMRKQL